MFDLRELVQNIFKMNLSPNEKLILLLLAKDCYEDGICQHIRNIREFSGLSKRDFEDSFIVLLNMDPPVLSSDGDLKPWKLNINNIKKLSERNNQGETYES